RAEKLAQLCPVGDVTRNYRRCGEDSLGAGGNHVRRHDHGRLCRPCGFAAHSTADIAPVDCRGWLWHGCNIFLASYQRSIKMTDIKRIECGQRMSQAVVANGTVWLAGQVAEPGKSVTEQ